MDTFSLYDDDKNIDSVNNDPESDHLIEIDLSSPNTLMQCIKPLKDYLIDKPDDLNITVYIVCGMNPSSDVNMFLKYLFGIKNPKTIIFRGIIHFEFIELFLKEKVTIAEGSKLLFNKSKLFDGMSGMISYQSNFRKFLQRFIDSYNQLGDNQLLDSTEFNLFL